MNKSSINIVTICEFVNNVGLENGLNDNKAKYKNMFYSSDLDLKKNIYQNQIRLVLV
jgi:hypothetical protein